MLTTRLWCVSQQNVTPQASNQSTVTALLKPDASSSASTLADQSIHPSGSGS
jgi:hypothetical protein